MTDETRLSHIDEQGRAQMVDVGAKADTERVAVAAGAVLMRPATLRLIQAEALPKGDVLAVARVAGIMAAKRTHELIPMCHPLLLTHIQIDFNLTQAASDDADADAVIHITGTVKTRGKTGVEMEALTAVSVAALTVYDMAKAVDKRMRIHAVRLVEKRGGKSGDLVLE